MGDFNPSPIGEMLMPVITEPHRASIAMLRSSLERFPGVAPTREVAEVRNRELERSPEQVALDAARARFDDLELELRGSDGARIPTENIHIQDCEFVISLAEGPHALCSHDDDEPLPEELEREIEEAVKRDLEMLEMEMDENEWGDGEAWKRDEERRNRPLPRYQLMVTLLDDDAIP